MPRNVRKFVNREFIRTVELDLLRRLLAPYAEQIGFDFDALPAEDRERREALFRFFASVDESCPSDLLDGLHCILLVASPNGVRLLREQAERQGLELIPRSEIEDERDGRHLTTRHVALRAYLDHRVLFDRVIDLLAFVEPASTLERSGREEDVPSLHEDPAARDAFRAACATYFAGRYLGRYCDVRWYPEHDEINILVLHGRNMRTANVEQDGEERTLPIREIAQDTVRYHPPTGRIRVSAQYASEKQKLVELFAEHLLGEPDFFEGADANNLYTLEPIHRAGTGFRLRTEWDEELQRTRISELQVDGGEIMVGGRRRNSPWALTVRDSTNAITRLAELAREVDLAGIRINYVKIELIFRLHGKPRRIVVKVKPPDLVSFRRDAFEDRIMEHLRRNGLCLPRPAEHAAAAD